MRCVNLQGTAEALFIRKTLVVKRAFLILLQYVFKSKSYTINDVLLREE